MKAWKADPLVLTKVSTALGSGKKRDFPAYHLKCSKPGDPDVALGQVGRKPGTKLAKLHQEGTKDERGSPQQASKYRAAAPRQEQAIFLPMSSFPACTLPPLTLWIESLHHFRVAKGGEEQKNLGTPLGPFVFHHMEKASS